MASFVIEQILSNALKYTNTGGEIFYFSKTWSDSVYKRSMVSAFHLKIFREYLKRDLQVITGAPIKKQAE